MSAGLKSPRYRITTHALERFAERCSDPSLSLASQLASSSPVGAQRGSGFARYLPCGLVAVGENDNGVAVVSTVLTRDQAMANMQASGVRASAPEVRNPTDTSIPVPKDDPNQQRQQSRYKRLLDCNLPDFLENSGDEISATINRIDPTKVRNKITHLAVWHAIRATPRRQRTIDLIDCQIALNTPEHAEYKFTYAGAKLANDALKSAIHASDWLTPGQKDVMSRLFDSFNEAVATGDE